MLSGNEVVHIAHNAHWTDNAGLSLWKECIKFAKVFAVWGYVVGIFENFWGSGGYRQADGENYCMKPDEETRDALQTGSHDVGSHVQFLSVSSLMRYYQPTYGKQMQWSTRMYTEA